MFIIDTLRIYDTLDSYLYEFVFGSYQAFRGVHPIIAACTSLVTIVLPEIAIHGTSSAYMLKKGACTWLRVLALRRFVAFDCTLGELRKQFPQRQYDEMRRNL